jgi:hypothetical protein
VKEQRLAFEAPASSSASPAFCAPGRPGAHSLLFSRYHQHQHQRRRQHQHPPGPPSGPYRGPATCCLSCPVQSCEPAFSSLSPRFLSRPRLFIWGLARGLWASGRLLSRSTQRHVRFFFSCRHGRLFYFFLSLSFRCFLSFFFGAISISLSLSHLHCPGSAPPRVAMSQPWADNVQTTYTNVT